MLDVSYFQNSTSNTQLFQNGGSWQTWVKPRGAKIVNFFVIGAGAGGGGGLQAAAGNKSGGSGGGNGGYTRLTVQASILPDILYVLPGTGGTGGTGGTSPTQGNSATKSYVSLIPDITSVSNIILTSGAVAAVGGLAGSTVANSSSAGETVAVSTNMVFVNLGNFLSTAGQAGSAGGLTTGNGAAVNAFSIVSGGGGGTSTGGGVNAGPFPGITSTPINTSGADGQIFYKPIFGILGGRGGGGGTTGGNGGNGGPGCGGGGGGAGTTSSGNGGKGGDGFVIITTNF